MNPSHSFLIRLLLSAVYVKCFLSAAKCAARLPVSCIQEHINILPVFSSTPFIRIKSCIFIHTLKVSPIPAVGTVIGVLTVIFPGMFLLWEESVPDFLCYPVFIQFFPLKVFLSHFAFPQRPQYNSIITAAKQKKMTRQ